MPVTRSPAGREALRRYLRGLDTPHLERYVVALLVEYFCGYYTPGYMAEYVELFDECQRRERAVSPYENGGGTGHCWDAQKPGLWLRCRRAARARMVGTDGGAGLRRAGQGGRD